MKESGNRVSLFLLELMFDLVLFAVCAAVCVGLLVHARAMSRESALLTEAVYAAQSIAEDWKADGVVPMWCIADEDGLMGGFHVHENKLDIEIYRQTGTGKTVLYSLRGVTYLG